MPIDQFAVTGPSVAVEMERPRVIWQVAPAARSLTVMGPELAQVAGDLGEGTGSGVDSGVDSGGEGLALLAKVGDGDGGGWLRSCLEFGCQSPALWARRRWRVGRR